MEVRAWPLRKYNFFEARKKNSEQECGNVVVVAGGGVVKALVAGSLKNKNKFGFPKEICV